MLALLALLPVYAFLRGRVGKFSALRFPSADIARAAGAAARSAAGRLLLFLRILTVALCIVALAGPRFANDRTETQASGVDIMLVFDLSWSMMALDMGGVDESGSRFGIASADWNIPANIRLGEYEMQFRRADNDDNGHDGYHCHG